MKIRFESRTKDSSPAEASGDTQGAQKLAPLEVRRILAPTDMSELSSKAVVHAVRLGLALQAQVIALYVSEVFVNPTGSPVDLGTVSAGEVDGWRQEIKRRFDAYLDRLARIPDNVVRLVRASMDPWKEITAVAKEMGVDLLVISTHGPRGFEYLIHGSDAAKIVRGAPCPVLVVHGS
jgi:nucleotide-binding universal stress UspA family protein